MSTEKMPEGFPLEPKDFEGNLIQEGGTVKILSIPESLIHDLDEESKHTVKNCEGTVMVINEIDDYGYAWVEKVTSKTEEEYKSNSFGMEPKNLLRQ